MKKLLFLSLFLIATIGSVHAQDPTKKSSKPTSYKGKDDNCMLNASYDKPMEITSHEKNKSKVNHQTSDYIQFNQNGTYIESINGVTSNGTWGYNYDTHEVTVNCNGIRTYKVNADSNGKIHLNGKNDQMKLTIKN